MGLKLPIVELDALMVTPSTDEMRSEQNLTSNHLIQAFEEFGIAYIRLDWAALMSESALDSAKTLFSIPSHVKESVHCDLVHRPGVTRGFLGFGSESGADILESKEAFSFSYDWESSETLPENPLEAINVWPSEKIPGLSEAKANLTKFYQSAGLIMQAVADAVKRNLDSNDQDNLKLGIEKGNTISLARCFHYFAQRNSCENETGSVPHTDWGFATLIVQDLQSPPALQLWHNGVWVDVPPIENTFVINCGDYASLLSGGRLRSPLHRVVLTETERFSLVYFQYPEYDSKLPQMADVPSLRSLSLLKDQSVNTEEAADEQLLGSFGECILRKWEQVQRPTGDNG